MRDYSSYNSTGNIDTTIEQNRWFNSCYLVYSRLCHNSSGHTCINNNYSSTSNTLLDKKSLLLLTKTRASAAAFPEIVLFESNNYNRIHLKVQQHQRSSRSPIGRTGQQQQQQQHRTSRIISLLLLIITVLHIIPQHNKYFGVGIVSINAYSIAGQSMILRRTTTFSVRMMMLGSSSSSLPRRPRRFNNFFRTIGIMKTMHDNRNSEVHHNSRYGFSTTRHNYHRTFFINPRIGQMVSSSLSLYQARRSSSSSSSTSESTIDPTIVSNGTHTVVADIKPKSRKTTKTTKVSTPEANTKGTGKRRITTTTTTTITGATTKRKETSKGRKPSSQNLSSSSVFDEAIESSSSTNNDIDDEEIVSSLMNILSFNSTKDTVLDDSRANGTDEMLTSATTDSRTTKVEKKVPFHPDDVLDPNFVIPYPKSLSPSSIAEYKKCPQSFLFQYIFGMKQPTTPALAKGSMCHTALERIFDIDPSDRSLHVLHNLFRTAWSERRNDDTYKVLFTNPFVHYPNIDYDSEQQQEPNGDSTGDESVPQRDVQAEIQWGREGLQLLANYWSKEDPSLIGRPNPIQREVWVSSKLKTDYFYEAKSAQTAIPNDPINEDVTEESATATDTTRSNNQFLVRGIVDRLDMVRTYDEPTEPVVLRLIDYKTGKAPELKYSPTMNEKIQQEAFDQLLIYALLLRERTRSKQQQAQQQVQVGSNETESAAVTKPKKRSLSVPLRFLRLFYLTSTIDPNDYNANHIASPAVYWDMDLGSTEYERDSILDSVYQELIMVWESINDLVTQQNLQNFYGCNRPYCTCHKFRPLFPSGSVWEPPPSLSSGR